MKKDNQFLKILSLIIATVTAIYMAITLPSTQKLMGAGLPTLIAITCLFLIFEKKADEDTSYNLQGTVTLKAFLEASGVSWQYITSHDTFIKPSVHTLPEDWILSLIDWQLTDQRFDFWDSLNDKWHKVLKDPKVKEVKFQ